MTKFAAVIRIKLPTVSSIIIRVFLSKTYF